MIFRMKYYLPILLLLFFSCRAQEKSENQKIYYLSQDPPSNIPEIFGAGIISVKGRFETGLTISPDGKSIAFGVYHESKPEETCMYLTNYLNRKWTTPTNTFLPDNVNTFYPMFGPFGNTLYFVKSKEGSETDLWSATYVNNTAINPQPLDFIFNSNSREAGHGKSKNGSFYFTSNRDDQHQCCGDIYHSEPEKGNYTKIQKVSELSSSADEESLFLSPMGDYIIIQAWQYESESKHDLFISYLTKTESWTIPERLDSEVNSLEIEQRPFISSDNQYLFFSRISMLPEHGSDDYESDIYWVSTASVFKPFPYHPIPVKHLEYNESFQIQLPEDIFKDVDNNIISYKLSLNNSLDLPEWIRFDEKKLLLIGSWRTKEPAILKITAIDDYGNKSILPLLQTKKN